MKKVNILFIIIQMEMGGSERLVHNLLQKLDRQIFSPSVAWFYGDAPLQEYLSIGIPLYHIRKEKRFDFATMRQLSGIIAANNIHIVNAHHFMSMVYSFYGCRIKNRAKLIYTEHSEWEIKNIDYKWRTLGRYILNCCETAVGVNYGVCDAIKDTFCVTNKKVVMIQNGVNMKYFVEKHRDTSLRKEIGITAGEKIIGIVANFKKNKNHIFLLKAFREAIRNHNELKLLMVGQGFSGDPENSEKEVRDYVLENNLDGRVIFLGYRKDVAELLRLMDVFCLTSYKEGLPISLIEAMATGLPIVASDIAGINDVVFPGKNGYLVTCDDIKGLSGAILRLLGSDSLRKRMGTESRLIAERSYSLDRCVREYENLFMSVSQLGTPSISFSRFS